MNHLLSGVKEVRICIDGADELAEKDQSNIISGLLPLAQGSILGTLCKMLFTSRDIRPISKHLAKHVTIALSEERMSIEPAISIYIKDSLADFREQMTGMGRQHDLVDRIEHDLVVKAEGLGSYKVPM